MSGGNTGGAVGAAATGAPPSAPGGGPSRSTALLDRLEAASSSAGAPQHAAAAAVRGAAEVREARRAFNSLLEMKVLDEKHFCADQLLAALGVLRRVVGNILDAPADPRFRRVKLSSKAWEGSVAPLGPDAERLLHMVGFRRRTVDMEAALVFEFSAAGAAAAAGGGRAVGGGVGAGSSGSADGAREWQLLAMAREVLANADVAMAAKATRAAQAKAARANRAAAEREKLRLALADDQQLRAAAYEARRRTGPALSDWRPGQRQSEGAAAGAGAGGGGGLGGEEGAPPPEGGEEDDDDEE